MNTYLDINEEVKEALENHKPVVALESTIISHGMPYPKNYETALEVENIVREQNSVPATIAIINGRLKAGLTKNEIEYLAKEGERIFKASRRDIAFIVSKKISGATTVASTMLIAEMAGIKIFATGGIGGVHRNANNSFDISADLQELAKTNIAVVCAGAKAILDLNLTLEYLETFGVPVIGYKTDELPAFYSRNSGIKLDFKMNSPKEIADFLNTKRKLNLSGGVVIANPIPKEYQMDFEFINKLIEQAVEESEKLKIKGKEITPFLLSKVKDLSGGKSLEANIQLVFNNAKLASEIACGLYQK